MAVMLAMAFTSLAPLWDPMWGPSPSAMFTVSAATTIEEVEPNSAMDQAMSISPHTFYRGAIDAAADGEDWYKLEVPKGWALNATVRIDRPYELNADLEVYYYYIDGKLDRKWSMTDYSYETVCILSVADQYYYLRVFVRSGSGTYTIDADFTEPETLSSGQTIRDKALYNDTYDVIDYYKVWLENKGTEADLVEATLTKTPIPPAQQVWFTLEVQHLNSWSAGLAIYDISWEDPLKEEVRAVASETGWYYLRVNCYNGSGTYNLSVKVTTIKTDGNDRLGDDILLYGPAAQARGSLDQGMDHRDVYSMYLAQGERLRSELWLTFSIDNPVIFSLTILRPDGSLVGEWTNYRDSGPTTSIQADLPFASETGKYTILLEAKVSVLPWRPQDTSENDGSGNYTLTLSPSGHNMPPETKGAIPEVTLLEDGAADLDLSAMFTDDNLAEGDALSYNNVNVKVFSGPSVDEPLAVTFGVDSPQIAHIEAYPNWSGAGALTFTCVDLFDAGASVAVPFTVGHVNDAPRSSQEVLSFILGENAEMHAIDLGTVFNDPDIQYGDTLSFRVDGNDTLPAWVDSKGTLIIGPVIGLGQEEAFTVVATDNTGAAATVQVIVHVADVEHPPRAASTSEYVTFNEDTSGRLSLYTIFTDPDPEDKKLSFQWTGNVKVELLLKDDGIVTFTPEANWWGTEYISVRAFDHSGLSASFEVIVRVDPVADGPVIVSADPASGSTIDLDGKTLRTISINLSDLDPEDQGRVVLIWYIDGTLQPGQATITHLSINGTYLRNGIHTLTLKVRDGYGLEASASWTLSVDKPIPKPVLARPTATQTTSTGGVAIGLWAIVLVFAAEPSRYSILKFLWVPLYTKIKKEEVLDQFVRGRIFGFIEHNPGVTYSQIKRKIGVGNGTLTHHLSMLEKQNYVKAERDGLYKRFYPRDFQIDEDAIELNTLQKDIYFLAKTRPGISQKEVSEELQVSERVMSYHIHLLQEARLIRVERSGRKHALFVVDN